MTTEFSRDFGRTDLDDPGMSAAEVTPSDSDDLTVTARAIYVGTSGDVKLTTANGQTATFVNAYGILPVTADRVWATGTTATNIVALW